MEDIIGEAVQPVVQRLVDPVINGAQYICCFNSYVDNFEEEKGALSAKLEDVKIEIGKARGVFKVKEETLHWEKQANKLIQVDTRIGKKWCFGKCPNCIWRYQRGRELANKTLKIQKLMNRSISKILAGPADVPGIKYHSLQNFIHFKSRKSKFQELLKALQDENCNMIGLHGMGGLGKTSLAIEVGKKLEEASRFDKVILLVVSKSPNYKTIRAKIARHLYFTLEEGTEEDHSVMIWSKITMMKERLLIILDDVWEVFDLKKYLGIPFGTEHKGCSILITTRIQSICSKCQKMIHLEMLTDKDALDLFLECADIKNSSSLKGVAKNIVERCKGVPIAIVAAAKTLKDRDPVEWKKYLQTLQNTKLTLDVDKNWIEVYKCLKLSYDNLKNETAKELFLICSLFPEDFEISMDALSRIGLGVGLFGDVDKYYTIRDKAHEAVKELTDSCLLLNIVEKELVKMHDLVREVALMTSEHIQLITACKTPIKEEVRYVFWKIDEFPSEFGGTNVEILIACHDGSEDLKVPNSFFVKMTTLKVLILANIGEHQCSFAPPSLYSLQPLKDIRFLTLASFILCDISVLGNLQNLENLWLLNCSISELPREFTKLEKLRVLELVNCKIEMTNPFEVIERCSQLEELKFVGNEYREERKDAVTQNISPLTLHRYQISSQKVSGYFGKYGSIARCFQQEDLRHSFSVATFKQLVKTAELLMLGGYQETGWKNLIPDIVSMEDEGMKDLTILHMSSWPNIQCLIDTKNHDCDVIAFSNLVELSLCNMDVEDLYKGSLSSSFLEQLEIMSLWKCQKLKNMLFNGNINLCHLKFMTLEDCLALKSLFQPFTAQSLNQLEELTIKNCIMLEYIILDKSLEGEIVNDDDDDDNQKSYGSLFPKLKTLQIEGCDKMKIILPIPLVGGLSSLEEIRILSSLEEIHINDCQRLEYIFGKFQENNHVILPSLKQMELSGVPSLIGIFREYHKPTSLSFQKPSSSLSRDNSKEKYAFSGIQVCCFLNKLRATSEETNVAISNDRLLEQTILQDIHGSNDGVPPFQAAKSLLIQSLNNIKMMKLVNCSNFVSLLTLPIASTILLESLTISRCHQLKCIVADEGDVQGLTNYCSIFQKLEELEIEDCKELEFLFPSTISIELEKLKSLTINDAPKLKYVIGKNQHEDLLSNMNHDHDLHFILCLQHVSKFILKYVIGKYQHEGHLSSLHHNHFNLPTLEVLCLQQVPNFSVMNYFRASLSLQKVVLENCSMKPFTDSVVCSNEEHLNWENTKQFDASLDVIPPLQAAQRPLIQSTKNIKEMTLVGCSNLTSLLTLPTALTISLEKLTIESCDELRCIVANEGDARRHKNHNSIFPKLKDLQIYDCNALEYLFPVSVFRFPIRLTSLFIWNATELKYMFGGICHQGCLSHDFPALESLFLFSVPNLMSICPENNCLRGPSLQSIDMKTCPKFIIRSFTDFLVCGHARQQDSTTTKEIETSHLHTLESLIVYDSKIEEIFNLTHLEVEKIEKGIEPLTSSLKYLALEDLSELRNICVGPKNILSLNNLSYLTISACKKLEVVFSASTLRSLHKLKELSISDCEELVYIIEEDNEKSVGDHLHHQPCFLELERLFVKGCGKLKYLFFITMPGILPKLSDLTIIQASYLKQLLVKRDETREMVMKDLLPNLRNLYLDGLPSLASVCNEIDFQTLEKSSKVHNCPRFSFYETSTQLIDGPKIPDCQGQAETEDKLSSYLSADESDMEERDTKKSTIGSPNFITTLYPCSSTSKKVPILMSTIVPPTGENNHMTAQIFEEEEEEEEEEGGLKTTRHHRNDINAGNSLPKEKPETSVPGDVQVSNKPQALATVSSGEVRVDPRPLMGRENLSSYSRGQTMEHHDAIESNILETNKASVVPGVQEIVDMMKLEGFEPSILAKALETHPKLILSANDRSTQMVCMSYKVLLDILNILTTRTPFTITEADKMLLEEKLKDAYFLGFDKDWLDSIKSRVFDCETSQVDCIQDLKHLEDDLKTNEAMVAAIHDEEVEAARVVELAQQKHANVVARHTDLLKARQGILARRHRCWEILAAKNRHFGF